MERSEISKEKRDEEKQFAHDIKLKAATIKGSQGKIVLIPQPSNDPRDPLNWPSSKKYGILCVVYLAGFAAAAAPIAHQTAYVVISFSYDKSPNLLSYSISAAIAGVVVGPILIAPLARLIGRSSTIFWSLVAVIATQIWAAQMTGVNDYVPFVISRVFSGLFTAVPTILGTGYIMDMCYLHQRGRAFACFELSWLLGVIASPTIGGFIVQAHPWPYVFWWTLGPLALSAILVFCFVHDTGFARNSEVPPHRQLPHSFLANRIATFLPGTQTVPHISISDFFKRASIPFVIGISPVTILAGTCTLVTFAWSILISVELAIFLETPVADGGYGFSPGQNAAFTFTLWVALFAGQLTSTFCNDRIPLWASRRYGGGHWRPEYRIWGLFFPALLAPVGLGIFGACLQHHCHYMVLALGAFLVEFSALLCVPVCINYVVECFPGYAIEVATIIGVYRLALGLSLEFYFQPWSARVGIGWLFGMAAFLSLFVLLVMVGLAWQGRWLRRFMLVKDVAEPEEGKRVDL